jgi:hypothetical protein
MGIRGLQSALFWAFRGKLRSKGLVHRERARRTELGNVRLHAGVTGAGWSGPGHPTFGLSFVEGLHKTPAVCGHNRTAIAGQCWIAGVNEVLDQIRRYGNPYACSFPGFPRCQVEVP